MRWLHLTFVLFISLGCGDAPSSERTSDPMVINSDLFQPPTSPDLESLDATPKSANQGYLLIQGAGPKLFVNMKYLGRYLQNLGVPAENIFLITYNFRDNIDEIENDVRQQIETIYNQNPRLDFDVIAHSLGSFVGLYTLARSQMLNRIGQFNHLAGVVFGQSKQEKRCQRGRCTDLISKLVPHQSSFVQKFWQQYESSINTIDHCSIYSLNDRLVNKPRTTGVIPGSQSHAIKGFGHLGFIYNPKVFKVFKDSCYAGNLP